MDTENKKLISIGKAAKKLGVSIDTLRRWDRSGKLRSIRIAEKGHRYYDDNEISLLAKDLFSIAKRWATTEQPREPESFFYCADKPTFQSRIVTLEKQLLSMPELKDDFSLITSIAGEIGNNSFDHNIGNWPDIRGIFFAYDLNKKELVLADRGRGVLETLKNAKPELANDKDALFTAFTEKISGRTPEKRGNGLKYVRKVITSMGSSIKLKLYFQSGQATLRLKHGDSELNIDKAEETLRGCLALITF